MMESSNESFDVADAIDALEMCAEFAPQFADKDGRLDPTSSLVRSAADLLLDSKAWLERHRTPFDDFSGEAVVQAQAEGTPIPLETFVSRLRDTVVELVQVNALV